VSVGRAGAAEDAFAVIDRAPPFHSSTGYFLEFEHRLHALLEFVAVSTVSVEREVERREEEFKRQMDEGPRLESGELPAPDGYWFDPAALEDYYTDWIATARDDYLPFVSMGGIALLFTLFERFLNDMAAEAARLAGSEELPRRRQPHIENALDFMRRACGMVVTLSEEDEQQLLDLRKVRNSLIHQLGSDIPDEVRTRLASLLPHGDFRFDMGFVEHAFEVVAGVATLLEEAFAERFGLAD
jgi:hypothetical protein